MNNLLIYFNVKMKNNVPIFLLSLIVAVSASFYGGMKYQQSKTPSLSTFRELGNIRGETGQAGNRIRTPGVGQTMGEIINIDDNSVTVKLADGSTKIVLIPDSVSINKSETGSKNDLNIGVNIAVFGSANDDGSVTAQNIQLNPGRVVVPNRE